MKIEHINDQLRQLFRQIIIENECGGNLALAYEFSDPDGERSGKSGWSFGVCQYDINNNGNALLALREIGFTTDEVRDLRAQVSGMDMKPMNAKLLAGKSTVDSWDNKQLSECLEWPLTLCHEINIEFSKMETFLHIADYHNQFGMSRGGKFYSFLQSCHAPVSPEMIRDFKYLLPWGQKQLAKNDPRHDDVLRRYNTIAKLVIPNGGSK